MQVTQSEVKFNSLLLAVADEDPRDLYDGLHDLYFGQEEVEIQGKTALKREELVQLPPLLHVQLQVSGSPLMLISISLLMSSFPASTIRSRERSVRTPEQCDTVVPVV